MSLRKPVTVAIADVDHDRRAGYERLLRGDRGIAVLADVASRSGVGDSSAFVNRRLKPRSDVSATENEVARVKRLKPLVLLVNLNLCTDEDYALLLSLRRECPDSLMVFLADDSIQENQLLQVLEIGARGYLKYEAVEHHLSMAIKMVGRGEAWVPRKIMGNILESIMH